MNIPGSMSFLALAICFAILGARRKGWRGAFIAAALAIPAYLLVLTAAQIAAS